MTIAVYREDGLASSVAVKGPCRAASTAPVALSGLANLDGIALAAGDRVLVKNQANPVENGIYVADTGPWRRAQDFAGNRDVRRGTRVWVHSGSAAGPAEYAVTTPDPIAIDTDPIAFALVASLSIA